MFNEGVCALCRGSKYLCGLTYCPIVVKFYSELRLKPVMFKDEVGGSSPPSVFVGRYGYPKVRVGPSIPPVSGDTSDYDLPEVWVGKPLEEILSKRLSMVVGVTEVKVDDLNSKILEKIQEIALSERSVFTELKLSKLISRKPVISEEVPPLGVRVLINDLRPESNVSFGRAVEKVFNDFDMRASEAVIKLYVEGIPISRIQRVLSVGALGKKSKRRLVPTRWSITAVDDITSKHLIKKLLNYEELNEVLVYVREYMKNLFIAILLPGIWSYEWIEAWFPGSTWNVFGRVVSIEGDYEGPSGRSDYALPGGCYYAARLAAAEHLYYRIKRQAMVFLYREIYEGFNIPVGVWFVRENIRKMFEGRPMKFSDVSEAIAEVSKYTAVPIEDVVRRSRILSSYGKVRRLDYYSTFSSFKRG
ncbi:MAG: hypothetical protein B7O98_07585 [Zestosphaera tikiterensis]|uniref:DNA repair protein n=1 Tax=Zestosphaera tikiterensis TaxID=1973259 RepID=A0A2R7Y4R4_9CREN|nr:MAG: hypothetical protein B7O98_07585 [Zestosphaera tikiterensis]